MRNGKIKSIIFIVESFPRVSGKVVVPVKEIRENPDFLSKNNFSLT